MVNYYKINLIVIRYQIENNYTKSKNQPNGHHIKISIFMVMIMVDMIQFQ
jgi:hypothetical protein